MYVLQASPLTRIFLPQYQRVLIDNPKLIEGMTEPFEVRIPRATGAVTLTHMKPVHQHNLLPKKHHVTDAAGNVRELKGARIADRDEIRDLVPWLTGGEDGMACEETDIYGVVQFDLGTDIVAEMVEAMQAAALTGDAEAGGDVGARLKKLQAEYKVKLAASLEEARQKANRKVRRALQITHTNLIQAWDSLEAEGKGRYQPSVAEGLGAYILREEIQQSESSRQQMHELMRHGSAHRPVVNG